MTTSCLDDAFDAYLAGRPVPVESAPIVEFADSVRAMSARPGRPSAGLAELLATGLVPGAADPSAAPAPPSRQACPALPERRTRRSRMFTVLAAAVAKFASAGAVAQATAGVGVALVAVSSAGAVGALPTPLQDRVAATVEAVTPLDLPDSADPVEGTDAERTDAEETTVEEPAVDGAVADEPTGPGELPSDFGTAVSEDARDGGVDGARISEDARATHQPQQPAGSASRAPERPAAPAAPEKAAPAPEVERAPAREITPAPVPEQRPATAGQPQDGTGRP